MKAQTIKRWGARGNVALAGVLGLCVASHVTSAPSRGGASSPIKGDLDLDPDEHRLPHPDFTLDELLRDLRRFHPAPASDRGPPPATEAVDPHAPLPLLVYRLVMYVFDPDGCSTAMIASKDPGRRATHHLRCGAVVDGIRLTELEVRNGIAVAHVERGDERAALSLSASWPGRVRIVAAAPSTAPSSPAASLASDVLEASVRCVPYFDAGGHPIGLRVTGVAQGSAFALAGLSAGDAIVALDGESVTSPATLVSRWREGWRPREVAILRASASANDRRTLQLR